MNNYLIEVIIISLFLMGTFDENCVQNSLKLSNCMITL